MNKFTLLFLALVLFGSIFFYLLRLRALSENIDVWISGKYGGKCYEEGHENKNIKYPLYFDSLEECEAYINQ